MATSRAAGDILAAGLAAGRGLARAAAAFARLDARAGAGFAKRLAFSEASALLWAQGDWVPPDKIALYGLLRESALSDARVLSKADWATRRMLGAGLPDDLGAFLGRHAVGLDGLEAVGLNPTLRRIGEEDDWQAAREELSDCHAITQAAALFSAWRSFRLSAPDDCAGSWCGGWENRGGGGAKLAVSTGGDGWVHRVGRWRIGWRAGLER